ncbi:MAG: histidine phosphatase family protein, partial [Natronospirillum sp.]
MSVLYLLRHGEADAPNAHDELRRLTDRGFQQVTRAAGVLPPQLVLYHSPYVRTIESAQAVERVAMLTSSHMASWLTP